MILPSGINKATGLAAALDEMGLSAHNVVGIGDAENDHAFLRAVGYGVAVANALPKLKETADRTMKGSARRRCRRAGRQDHLARRRIAGHRAPARRDRRRCRRRGGPPFAARRQRALGRHVGDRQVDAGDRAHRAFRQAGISVLRARPRRRLRGARRCRDDRRCRQLCPAARDLRPAVQTVQQCRRQHGRAEDRRTARLLCQVAAASSQGCATAPGVRTGSSSTRRII